ncbi:MULTISPECIES: Ldh family oxidoreductase [unclassified Haematobacter]|uniref:Ldh family oxidoreductase n=1 Tax=unclassified Haematobacter TaxID=2640585 RepID=UPI0025BFE8B1|nr:MULTISPECIES: Ldh family oxidoreductase [unclassified Haematobacter]
MAITIKAEDLCQICATLFEGAGVPAEDAQFVADSLVEADLTGVESHGVSRTATYLNRLRQGGLQPVARTEVIQERAATALVDGHHAMGQVTAKRAMELAIRKAREAGTSFVVVRNSDHYGAAAYFSRMALEHGMIGFTGSNGAARVAPWGGRAPVYGTNPSSIAIPARNALPFVFDMASCVVARGKIILANKKGEPIPEGWALTRDGAQTTDAKEALAGVLLPFGGPKGSAIAGMIEVLSGVLANSRLSTQLLDMASNPDKANPVSHYFGAIDISAFGAVDDFVDNMDAYIASVKAVPKAEGVSEIYLPGEIEAGLKQRRLESGIALPNVVRDELAAEGARLDRSWPALQA